MEQRRIIAELHLFVQRAVLGLSDIILFQCPQRAQGADGTAIDLDWKLNEASIAFNDAQKLVVLRIFSKFFLEVKADRSSTRQIGSGLNFILLDTSAGPVPPWCLRAA